MKATENLEKTHEGMNLLAIRHGMTFYQCLLECCLEQDFVAQFNRLSGCSLAGLQPQSTNTQTGASAAKTALSPIEKMIDRATGFRPGKPANTPLGQGAESEPEVDSETMVEFRKFVDFCWEYVFLRFGAPSGVFYPDEQQVPLVLEELVEKMQAGTDS